MTLTSLQRYASMQHTAVGLAHTRTGLAYSCECMGLLWDCLHVRHIHKLVSIDNNVWHLICRSIVSILPSRCCNSHKMLYWVILDQIMQRKKNCINFTRLWKWMRHHIVSLTCSHRFDGIPFCRHVSIFSQIDYNAFALDKTGKLVCCRDWLRVCV